MTLGRGTALVTGGSGGIGTPLCTSLVAAGYRVVVADLVPPRGGLDLGFVRTDVTVQESLDAAVEYATSSTGRLDALFLNTGVTSESVRFDQRIDIEHYRRAVAINLDGVVFGVNAALPALRQRGRGAIVVTASLAGMMGIPTDPVYSATKHAVVGLVRSLGSVLPRGITINAVCPTFTDTPILAGIRARLEADGAPILAPSAVADALVAAANTPQSGQCYFVQAGRPVGIFEFRRPPGPR
ncbi:SDR family NAD(P)-dependent oxidoreductase [Streptomyces sp. NPDC051219]|uniref:SDR family NAD(P)-dependent oxidoreductase n=1 Tax=Streptomyces sp. NPDC051219 TaxID=3155283 RepID=UPI00342DCF36